MVNGTLPTWIDSVLCLCLKIYLIIGVSTASCERSFPKLKMIKSYLHSTVVRVKVGVTGFANSFRRKWVSWKAWFWRYNLWFCFSKSSTRSMWVITEYCDQDIRVRIELGVWRCAEMSNSWNPTFLKAVWQEEKMLFGMFMAFFNGVDRQKLFGIV